MLPGRRVLGEGRDGRGRWGPYTGRLGEAQSGQGCSLEGGRSGLGSLR